MHSNSRSNKNHTGRRTNRKNTTNHHKRHFASSNRGRNSVKNLLCRRRVSAFLGTNPSSSPQLQHQTLDLLHKDDQDQQLDYFAKNHAYNSASRPSPRSNESQQEALGLSESTASRSMSSAINNSNPVNKKKPRIPTLKESADLTRGYYDSLEYNNRLFSSCVAHIPASRGNVEPPSANESREILLQAAAVANTKRPLDHFDTQYRHTPSQIQKAVSTGEQDVHVQSKTAFGTLQTQGRRAFSTSNNNNNGPNLFQMAQQGLNLVNTLGGIMGKGKNTSNNNNHTNTINNNNNYQQDSQSSATQNFVSAIASGALNYFTRPNNNNNNKNDNNNTNYRDNNTTVSNPSLGRNYNDGDFYNRNTTSRNPSSTHNSNSSLYDNLKSVESNSKVVLEAVNDLLHTDPKNLNIGKTFASLASAAESANNLGHIAGQAIGAFQKPAMGGNDSSSAFSNQNMSHETLFNDGHHVQGPPNSKGPIVDITPVSVSHLDNDRDGRSARKM